MTSTYSNRRDLVVSSVLPSVNLASPEVVCRSGKSTYYSPVFALASVNQVSEALSKATIGNKEDAVRPLYYPMPVRSPLHAGASLSLCSTPSLTDSMSMRSPEMKRNEILTPLTHNATLSPMHHNLCISEELSAIFDESLWKDSVIETALDQDLFRSFNMDWIKHEVNSFAESPIPGSPIMEGCSIILAEVIPVPELNLVNESLRNENPLLPQEEDSITNFKELEDISMSSMESCTNAELSNPSLFQPSILCIKDTAVESADAAKVSFFNWSNFRNILSSPVKSAVTRGPRQRENSNLLKVPEPLKPRQHISSSNSFLKNITYQSDLTLPSSQCITLTPSRLEAEENRAKRARIGVLVLVISIVLALILIVIAAVYLAV